VAHALQPEDEAAAAAWIKPLKEKLLAGDGVEVIDELDQQIAGRTTRVRPSGEKLFGKQPGAIELQRSQKRRAER
jgi:hypothetical protein